MLLLIWVVLRIHYTETKILNSKISSQTNRESPASQGGKKFHHRQRRTLGLPRSSSECQGQGASDASQWWHGVGHCKGRMLQTGMHSQISDVHLKILIQFSQTSHLLLSWASLSLGFFLLRLMGDCPRPCINWKMRPVSTKIETPHLCQSGQKALCKDVVAKRCNADNDFRTKHISWNDREIQRSTRLACARFWVWAIEEVYSIYVKIFWTHPNTSQCWNDNVIFNLNDK